MPRTYTPRARAQSTARTRERIIETARKLVAKDGDLAVDRIAAKAGVSVQTLYTHFGSKRGLLLAVLDSTQRDVGLYADFDRVWASRDGETALRRMLEATFSLWHRGWDLVGFSERVRQSDPEIGAYLREVDGYRRANLRSITDRLALEGRLSPGLDASAAADVAFSLTVPRVYEELVRVRGWAPDRAGAITADAAVAAVVDVNTNPITDPPADWSDVVRPSEVIDLARMSPANPEG